MSLRTHGASARGDERGTVMIEYIVVLTFVTLSCAMAAATLAPRMLALFRVQTLVLSAPWLF